MRLVSARPVHQKGSAFLWYGKCGRFSCPQCTQTSHLKPNEDQQTKRGRRSSASGQSSQRTQYSLHYSSSRHFCNRFPRRNHVTCSAVGKSYWNTAPRLVTPVSTSGSAVEQIVVCSDSKVSTAHIASFHPHIYSLWLPHKRQPPQQPVLQPQRNSEEKEHFLKC